MKNTVFIIGLGAAGLMAAGSASEAGASVTGLERNPQPGRKVLISGKGRCNVTNSGDLQDFIQAFGKKGQFLYGALTRFTRDDLLSFFSRAGVETITERGGRIFPASELSTDILKALVKYALAHEAKLCYSCPVERIVVAKGKVTGVISSNGQMAASAVILTAGGSSYPGTGSDGSGYRLAREAGHTIITPLPSLTSLETAEAWVPKLQGLSLKNVEITLRIRGKAVETKFGEMIFTHYGISGPIVLDMSRTLVEATRPELEKALQPQNPFQKALHVPPESEISLNLKPALSIEQLTARLQRDFDTGGKKFYASILKDLLPASLIPVIIDLSKIPRDKPGNQISKAERDHLIKLLTDLRMTVNGLRSFGEAIVTSGGVDLKEVDPRTMESKLIKGLYFAGEVLDLDAKTGGYNLQAAFSTGYLAGLNAAGSLSV